MNRESYTQKELRAYLLGLLKEAEAEHFDELSFTDDDFAAALKAAENDFIDAYLRGELGGETLETFKFHYLATPLRREKVEFAETLQIFGEQKIAEKHLASVEKTSNGFFAVLAGFISSKSLKIGFAAGLVLLSLSGLWFLGNYRAVPQTEVVIQNSPDPKLNETSSQSPQYNSNEREVAAVANENSLPQIAANKAVKKNPATETNNLKAEKTPQMLPKATVATFVLAPVLRGTNQLKTFYISKETIDVAIILQLEADDYATYRVALTNETSSANIWQSPAIKTRGKNENKTLNIRFPAKLLKSQIHSLTVSGIKDGETEIISNYSFRIGIK